LLSLGSVNPHARNDEGQKPVDLAKDPKIIEALSKAMREKQPAMEAIDQTSSQYVGELSPNKFSKNDLQENNIKITVKEAFPTNPEKL
jgi:uncharacterized protein YggE